MWRKLKQTIQSSFNLSKQSEKRTKFFSFFFQITLHSKTHVRAIHIVYACVRVSFLFLSLTLFAIDDIVEIHFWNWNLLLNNLINVLHRSFSGVVFGQINSICIKLVAYTHRHPLRYSIYQEFHLFHFIHSLVTHRSGLLFQQHFCVHRIKRKSNFILTLTDNSGFTFIFSNISILN